MGLYQFQAEAQCVAEEAKLTGLQTNEERRQDCGVQFFFRCGTTNPIWQGFIHGELNYRWCTYADDNSRIYAFRKLET
ncbi:hypothetical protein B9Z55_018291 [Caenorhabditis nigoni]|uniref:Uncharacterized protein n=1 Tax=Caenorhabditis nigoni TaxID=1611254 RepID=A0A2G5TDQ8_9PELO|nr:hypothetical protein B9Z55_018291 [Caenorhabditis nigoni]